MRTEGNVVYLDVVTEQEKDYFKLAKDLAAARVRFSQAFQAHKAMKKGVTDEQARQVAIEMTGDEITVIEAAMKIAEERLG